MADDGGFYWLSFCDAGRAPGTQFLGACIVRAGSVVGAIREAHWRGCNPGGEAVVVPIPAGMTVREEWKNRLLSREDCAAVDSAMVLDPFAAQ